MSMPSEKLCSAMLAEMRRSGLSFTLDDLVLLSEPALGRPIPTDEAADAAEFCARRGWATAFTDDFGTRRYLISPLGRAMSGNERLRL